MRKGCLFVEPAESASSRSRASRRNAAENQPGGPRTRMVKHGSGGPLGTPGAQPGTSQGWQWGVQPVLSSSHPDLRSQVSNR